MLRWLFVSGSFGVVWVVVFALSKSQERATTISIFLALLLLVTFNHNVEQPHDVLDMAVFALGTYFTVRGRWRSLLLLAIACAIHRESAAFMGILWWGYHYKSKFALLEGIIVAIANYALVLVVRLMVAGPAALQGTQWLSLVHPLPFFQKFFVDNEIFLAFAAIVLIATWLSLGTQGIPRRLVVVAVGIAGVSLIFGLFYELRIFIPSLTILVIGSVLGVSPVKGSVGTSNSVTQPV